ncbi:MAG: hypothetical protein KGL37_13750, partial [Acidobacteriota bacterium]|nr:hypothetical protein [Acidobacteriota bacterium]
MSARSSMHRTVLILVALALLLPAAANGSPVPQAKTHRKASAASTSHRSPQATRNLHHARTSRHTGRSHAAVSRSSLRKTHRPTPQEVGRAAGLKIRRELNSRKTTASTRRRLTARARRSRALEARKTAAAARPAMSKADALPARRRASDEASKTEAPTAAMTSEAHALPSQSHQSDEANDTEAATDDPPAASEERVPLGRPERTSLAGESGADSGQALLEAASLHTSRAAMPAPLRGSYASLARQNERLDAEGLERILDDNDLESRIDHHLLVPVPVSEGLTVNENLPVDRRYCRPWTARFLEDLAMVHAALFHRPLEVTSAVRTVAYQKRLMRTNGNATSAEGDIVSPHVT